MITILNEKRWNTVDIYFFGVRTKRRFYNKAEMYRYVEYVESRERRAREEIKKVHDSFLKDIRTSGA